VDVQQQPDLMTVESEVRQQLRFMDRQSHGGGLQFDDYQSFYDEIEPIAGIYTFPSVHDRQTHLHLDTNPSHAEFVDEPTAVRAFEEARAERGVNGNR